MGGHKSDWGMRPHPKVMCPLIHTGLQKRPEEGDFSTSGRLFFDPPFADCRDGTNRLTGGVSLSHALAILSAQKGGKNKPDRRLSVDIEKNPWTISVSKRLGPPVQCPHTPSG
jgi:hypothetical protein